MARIKKLGMLSMEKLQAVILALSGLIAGIVYSFGGAIYDILVSTGWITSGSTPGVGYGTALAFLALIGMPVIFAAFGFIAGLFEAILYNIFAGRFGGIEFEFEQYV